MGIMTENQYPAALANDYISFPHLVYISNIEISVAKNIFVEQVLNDLVTY